MKLCLFLCRTKVIGLYSFKDMDSLDFERLEMTTISQNFFAAALVILFRGGGNLGFKD